MEKFCDRILGKSSRCAVELLVDGVKCPPEFGQRFFAESGIRDVGTHQGELIGEKIRARLSGEGERVIIDSEVHIDRLACKESL